MTKKLGMDGWPQGMPSPKPQHPSEKLTKSGPHAQPAPKPATPPPSARPTPKRK